MTMRMILRPGAPPIAWGKADSPRRPLCAICHGALPEVPLMMWNSKGDCVSFCDSCLEQWVVFQVGKPQAPPG